MARPDLFTVRVTNEERELFSRVAAELRVSSAEACRVLFREAARQLDVLPPERLPRLELSRKEVRQPK